MHYQKLSTATTKRKSAIKLRNMTRELNEPTYIQPDNGQNNN